MAWPTSARVLILQQLQVLRQENGQLRAQLIVMAKELASRPSGAQPVAYTVDYTLFGHQHATAIGDYHARNASLVGSNAYSEAGLNDCSKAAQNVHIVSKGTIDGVKVDLPGTRGITPYPPVREWEAYNPRSQGKTKPEAVVFQVVI